MNRDEFVSKFKLGQRIRANGWAVGEYGVITGFGPTNFSISVFIDEECHDVNVFDYDDVMFCDSWQHYEEPKIPGSDFVNMNNCGEGVFGKGCEHEIMFEKKAGDENKAYAKCLKCGEWVEVKQAKPKKLYAPAIVVGDHYPMPYISNRLYSSLAAAAEEIEKLAGFAKAKVIWPAKLKNGYFEIEEEE